MKDVFLSDNEQAVRRIANIRLAGRNGRLAGDGVVPVTRTDMVYEAFRAVTERTFISQ